MIRAIPFVAVVFLLCGCFPGFYHERVESRVVDRDGKPVPGARVKLGIYKDCANLGGHVMEAMGESHAVTDADGKFRVGAWGSGMLSFYVAGSCNGFSRVLQICKDGRGINGYYKRPGESVVPRVNGAGDFVFEPRGGRSFVCD